MEKKSRKSTESTLSPALSLQGRGSEPEAADEETSSASVVYHAGPCEIHFCGRMWFRDLSQRATADEWAAMQAHPHFGQFDFKVKE